MKENRLNVEHFFTIFTTHSLNAFQRLCLNLNSQKSQLAEHSEC